jgi:hypothetical protein
VVVAGVEGKHENEVCVCLFFLLFLVHLFFVFMVLEIKPWALLILLIHWIAKPCPQLMSHSLTGTEFHSGKMEHVLKGREEHACNITSQEAEAEEFRVQVQLGLNDRIVHLGAGGIAHW